MKNFLVLLAIGVSVFFVWQQNLELKEIKKQSAATNTPAPTLPATTAKPIAPLLAKFERTSVSTGIGGSRNGSGGSVTIIQKVQLASNEARKFQVTLQQIIPGNAALAHGCFYDVPAEQTVFPEKLDPDHRRWTQAGDIYILGVNDAIDGQAWQGWLVREGNETFTTALGTYRTIPSYRVIDTPKAAGGNPNHTGSWMWDNQHKSQPRR